MSAHIMNVFQSGNKSGGHNNFSHWLKINNIHKNSNETSLVHEMRALILEFRIRKSTHAPYSTVRNTARLSTHQYYY